MKIQNNYKLALICTFMPLTIALIMYKIKIYEVAKLQAICFLLIALLCIFNPKIGNHIYEFLAKVGQFLGTWIAKIVLFIIWIFSVMPIGFLMKLVKRDRLKLKKQNVSSYWLDNKNQNTDYEYQF